MSGWRPDLSSARTSKDHHGCVEVAQHITLMYPARITCDYGERAPVRCVNLGEKVVYRLQHGRKLV